MPPSHQHEGIAASCRYNRETLKERGCALLHLIQFLAIDELSASDQSAGALASSDRQIQQDYLDDRRL